MVGEVAKGFVLDLQCVKIFAWNYKKNNAMAKEAPLLLVVPLWALYGEKRFRQCDFAMTSIHLNHI